MNIYSLNYTGLYNAAHRITVDDRGTVYCNGTQLASRTELPCHLSNLFTELHSLVALLCFLATCTLFYHGVTADYVASIYVGFVGCYATWSCLALIYAKHLLANAMWELLCVQYGEVGEPEVIRAAKDSDVRVIALLHRYCRQVQNTDQQASDFLDLNPSAYEVVTYVRGHERHIRKAIADKTLANYAHYRALALEETTNES